MEYRECCGHKLSALGFGTMRLPLISGGDSSQIDRKQVDLMVDYAIKNGVNYFDTAFPYHAGMSERVIGESLKRYPRDSYYLATKYPGHQISEKYEPERIFEAQLKKCGVEYFDFYLLHNVYENSICVYTSPEWGIIDYFIEQKKAGRIKHLGFSSHGGPELLRTFLGLYGDVMEFCQLQLNYLDWTLQDARTKYQIVTEHNIPVFVMEPLRGGRLAVLDEGAEKTLKGFRPDTGVAAWAFLWLLKLPNVKMILSGMSDIAQMMDNVNTFTNEKPLSDEEKAALDKIAAAMHTGIPCTACRYCCDGCPMKLDIPLLISLCNEIRFAPAMNTAMRLDAMEPDKLPSACIQCGRCVKVCPQGIKIPEIMRELDASVAKIPKWADICKQREEEAKRNSV